MQSLQPRGQRMLTEIRAEQALAQLQEGTAGARTR